LVCPPSARSYTHDPKIYPSHLHSKKTKLQSTTAPPPLPLNLLFLPPILLLGLRVICELLTLGLALVQYLILHRRQYHLFLSVSVLAYNVCCAATQ
jgi:hypothetical protein